MRTIKSTSLESREDQRQKNLQIIQENNLLHSLGNEGHISGVNSEENLDLLHGGTTNLEIVYGDDPTEYPFPPQNQYIDQQMIQMRQSWLENELQSNKKGSVTREADVQKQ